MDNPNVGPTGSEQGNPWIDTMKDAPEFGEASSLEQAEQGQDRPMMAEGDGASEALKDNAKDKTLEELWEEAKKTEDYEGFYENAEVVDRESQDASVLLSFCDINSVNRILASDSYGVLLINGVRMGDLFESDALFNEQYYGDGSSIDYEWRARIPSEEGRTTLLEAKRRYTRGEREDKSHHSDIYSDMDRTKEARQAIRTIADTYFGEDVEADVGKKFKEIVEKRAEYGIEALTDEDKEFLRESPNPVADRLLYGPKITSEERARDILRGLDESVKEYEEYKDSDERSDLLGLRDDSRLFLSRIYYAANAIDDYDEVGKSELVDEARAKLYDVVNKNLDLVIDEEPNADDMYISPRELLLQYANPLELLDKSTEYDLQEQCGIGVGDIIDRIGDECEQLGLNQDEIFSSRARALKELGASDEEIMERMGTLSPVDFTGEHIKIGTDLLEAGISKEAVLSHIYSADNPFEYNRDPFRVDNGIDFRGRTAFSVLEELGFTANQIAETYNPEMIIKRLPEFIEHGADVKELLSYMMSYSEHDDYDEHDDKFTLVYDKNHPEGRRIEREKLGNGKSWVRANMEVLAQQGIREEDIFKHLDGYDECGPSDSFIHSLLDCPSFDQDKVLRMAFEKYRDGWAEASRAHGQEPDILDPLRYLRTLLRTYDDDEIRGVLEQDNELFKVTQ